MKEMILRQKDAVFTLGVLHQTFSFRVVGATQ